MLISVSGKVSIGGKSYTDDVKYMKAKHANEARKFEDIPNVGPRIARDLRRLGFRNPQELKKHDPFRLYKKLCKRTHLRKDPCVLDVFMSVIDFMNGAPRTPWWHYTEERKRRYPRF